jgi:hypothetical protein
LVDGVRCERTQLSDELADVQLNTRVDELLRDLLISGVTDKVVEELARGSRGRWTGSTRWC